MQLTVRPLAIDTFRENTLLLSRDCRALRPERLAGVRKVEIRAGGRTLLAAVVICDDPALVGPLEAGLTQPAFRRLGVAAGTPVHVAPAPPPAGSSKKVLAWEMLPTAGSVSTPMKLTHSMWPTTASRNGGSGGRELRGCSCIECTGSDA